MIDPNDMEIINLKITAKVSNVSNNDFVTTANLLCMSISTKMINPTCLHSIDLLPILRLLHSELMIL